MIPDHTLYSQSNAPRWQQNAEWKCMWRWKAARLALISAFRSGQNNCRPAQYDHEGLFISCPIARFSSLPHLAPRLLHWHTQKLLWKLADFSIGQYSGQRGAVGRSICLVSSGSSVATADFIVCQWGVEGMLSGLSALHGLLTEFPLKEQTDTGTGLMQFWLKNSS